MFGIVSMHGLRTMATSFFGSSAKDTATNAISELSRKFFAHYPTTMTKISFALCLLPAVEATLWACSNFSTEARSDDEIEEAQRSFGRHMFVAGALFLCAMKVHHYLLHLGAMSFVAFSAFAQWRSIAPSRKYRLDEDSRLYATSIVGLPFAAAFEEVRQLE